jgi:hypothetical protein
VRDTHRDLAAWVFQTDLKTGGGMTVGDTRGTIVEVVSEPATLPLPFSMY